MLSPYFKRDSQIPSSDMVQEWLENRDAELRDELLKSNWGP